MHGMNCNVSGAWDQLIENKNNGGGWQDIEQLFVLKDLQLETISEFDR